MTLKQRLAAVPGVGTAMAVQKRTKADAADQFAAALAFFGFLSLFPLIAVAVAVTGWLLADQPDLVANVVDAIQGAIPGLQSDTIDGILTTIIDNAGSIGLIGFGGALFAGMRITKASQTATRFVFGMDLVDVSYFKALALQLGSLLVLGVLALAGFALSGWVQSVALAGIAGDLDILTSVGAFLASAVLDVLLFWTAYRLYSIGSAITLRQLLPGALLGGVAWATLKYAGGYYVARQAQGSVVTDASGASATAVLLGTMIGLLLLFYLAGRGYVYGAELSAELAGFGDRRASSPDPGSREDPSSAEAGTAAELVSGGRDGLVAALAAHEHRRGVSSPRRDDTGSLFALGDSATDDDAARDLGVGGALGVVARAPAPGVPVVDGAHAESHADADEDLDDEGHDDDEGVDDDEGIDDMVVTIGHEPDPTLAGAAAVAPVATRDQVEDAHAAWAPAHGGASASSAGRELVPYRQSSARGLAQLAEDPTARRIAVAAAVGLVGVAAGLLRRRGQG